ncbi:uncharacterized protein PHALS_13435 [Plasmopara halstedii]|uniref:Uncharacterized protein n=1 Tax=Plasmopara halstedii TaxID=4781 RepID=A0A0P1APM8_PLAHL|nr:uncharacterized protein PHALS_13435 [Plasmopara halstedii]CEG43223.1 hypothetical protein PHALS_13435 [Plasmopara halstedii]|eukprot:XP_024579592.1 hypothetical protein PHALS_13435 [Plasmopara halstedii]
MKLAVFFTAAVSKPALCAPSSLQTRGKLCQAPAKIRPMNHMWENLCQKPRSDLAPPDAKSLLNERILWDGEDKPSGD